MDKQIILTSTIHNVKHQVLIFNILKFRFY